MAEALQPPAAPPGAPGAGDEAVTARPRKRVPEGDMIWRTGSALFLAQGIAGGLGALAWLVAARTHSAQAVGTALALCGALTWTGLVGNLGLGSTVLGWGRGRAPAERAAVASAAVGLAALSSGALGLAVGWALRFGHGALGATAAQPVVVASLAAGAAGWAAGVVLDHVAVAASRPRLAVERSVVSGVSRLLILGACLASGVEGATPLVAGWSAAILVGSVVAALRLRGAGALGPRTGPGPRGLTLARLGMRTHHFVNLFGQTPPMVIPVVVAARAGGAAAAAFGAAWQIAGTVGLLSPAVATGLFAAAGSDGRALPDRARATARQVALVIGAAGLVLVVAGPRLLAVVGPGYVDRGLPALRLLAVALVADAVTNVEIARLRVLGDFRSAISLNGLMAAVAVGGAFVLVGEHGATGAAAAWLAAQAVGAGSAWQRARWRDGRRYPARQEAAA